MGTHPIFESDFDCLTELYEMNESYSERDLVFLLELCGHRKWTQAFLVPFTVIPNFKPTMPGAIQALSCIVNLNETIRNQDQSGFQQSFLQMERIPAEFVETDELEEFSGCLLSMLNKHKGVLNWKILTSHLRHLERKWLSMIPKSKLEQMVAIAQNEGLDKFKPLLTTTIFSMLNELTIDFSESTAKRIMCKVSESLNRMA